MHLFFTFCIIDFRFWLLFNNFCIFLLGRYDKFDSIVSPSTESRSFFKTIYKFITGSITDISDTEEFLLCLRAFLPKYTFCSWCMEDVIESYRTVGKGLYEMSFTVSGPLCWRFLNSSNFEKKKVKQRY